MRQAQNAALPSCFLPMCHVKMINSNMNLLDGYFQDRLIMNFEKIKTCLMLLKVTWYMNAVNAGIMQQDQELQRIGFCLVRLFYFTLHSPMNLKDLDTHYI